MPQQLDRKVITISKSKTSDPNTNTKSTEVESDDPIMVPKSISKLIVKKRNEKEMTQKDLQTKANIPSKVLSDWETGKGIWNTKIAEKIGKVLGIDMKTFNELLKSG